MSATVKDIAGGISKMFWVYFLSMLFFFCVDLLTDFLVVTGHTQRQVGGDLAKDAYQGLFLVMISIARAEGDKIVNSLKGGAGTATETTSVEVRQEPESRP